MGRYNNLIDPQALDYVLDHSVRESDVLCRLREETASHPNARFQIPPEQGQLMRILARMTTAKRTIEVGVFTGYSAICTAMALPPEGKIVACDVSQEFTDIARRYWEEAGVANKIDLRIGLASNTLDKIIVAGESGTYDFAFIDADKKNYPGYYEQCLTLIRPGGVIALDNMFQNGQVMDESGASEDVLAIRTLNKFIRDDERVDAILLTVADGITLAVKR
jgi:predicted O-methyltransferase YrrM